MTIESIRKYRGVPAKVGMRVFYRHNGKYGTIKSARCGYLKILLDGDKWPQTFHPTWRLDYLDKDGTVLFASPKE